MNRNFGVPPSLPRHDEYERQALAFGLLVAAPLIVIAGILLVVGLT